MAAVVKHRMGSIGLSSVRDLAKACSIGPGTAQNVLKGETEPRLGTLLGLVQGLKLRSLEELLGEFGTMYVLEGHEENNLEHRGKPPAQ